MPFTAGLPELFAAPATPAPAPDAEDDEDASGFWSELALKFGPTSYELECALWLLMSEAAGCIESDAARARDGAGVLPDAGFVDVGDGFAQREDAEGEPSEGRDTGSGSSMRSAPVP